MDWPPSFVKLLFGGNAYPVERLKKIISGNDSNVQLTDELKEGVVSAYQKQPGILDELDEYIETRGKEKYEFSQAMKQVAAALFIKTALEGTNDAAKILDEKLAQVGQE